MQKINSLTKQLAIIGDPVEHSFSPKMHNFLSQKYNNNYVYTALRVESENLENATNALRAMNFAGVNVTAPHKFAVIPYLDWLSSDAEMFSSVNTIVNENGKLKGYNTDAEGFYNSLLYEGIKVKDQNILFIGAGGATQPVALFLASKGAKSITIKNRTQANADRIASYVYEKIGYKVHTTPLLCKYDIVINTTTVGMFPNVDLCPLEDFSIIDENSVAVDMIYNPDMTLFLKKAKMRGAKTLNGLGMLISQGLLSYELFTKTTLPQEAFELVKKEVFGK